MVVQEGDWGTSISSNSSCMETWVEEVVIWVEEATGHMEEGGCRCKCLTLTGVEVEEWEMWVGGDIHLKDRVHKEEEDFVSTEGIIKEGATENLGSAVYLESWHKGILKVGCRSSVTF